MLKRSFRKVLLVFVLLVGLISCTKEITEDLFNFTENFFTLQVSADKNDVGPEDLINFTLELQENELPSVYALDFSTNRGGVFRFDSNNFESGQGTSIESGIYNFTYFPAEEGIHSLTFTVTNANENPLSAVENFSISVGDVSDLKTDFNLTITSSSETVELGNLVTVSVNIVEDVDVPENISYTINFGASGVGNFIFEEENYGNEAQIIVEETELIFQFIPEEAIEYDLKFSVTSEFDETSICESVIFAVEESGSNSEIPVITLNGENPLVLVAGDEYIETATITDDVDTNIEILFAGDFDGTTNMVGEFIRTYNAIDSDNNVAEEQIRTIIIEPNDGPVLIEGITISPAQLELALDTTQQLTTTFAPRDLAPTNTVLEWVSSNELVATVSDTGLVTAIGAGFTEITAISTDGSEISSSIMVEIREVPVLVEEIIIQSRVTPLEEKQQETFTVFITPVNATNQSVLWTSSNPEVATVNESTGLVTAVSAGTVTISVETLDGSNLENSFDVVVEGLNTAPVAIIIADFISGVAPLIVNFDGSGSFDAEDEGLTYVWEIDGAGFETSDTASWTFESAGEFLVELKVWDSENLEGSDSITIIVTESNTAPVASISTDIATGVAPLRVDFDGTASFDAEDNELTYVWAIDGSEFEMSDTASWIFQDAGAYEVELTVVDSNGLEGLDSITIIVTEPVNNPPVIENIVVSPTSGTTETSFNFISDVNDPDNDNLSYSWSIGVGGSVFSLEQALTSTFNTIGEIEIVLTVTDESGATDTGSVTIMLNEPEIPVTEVIITEFVTSINNNESINFSAIVVPENATYDEVTWSSSNSNIDIDTFSGIAVARGTGEVTITATVTAVNGDFTDSVDVIVEEEDDDEDPTDVEDESP